MLQTTQVIHVKRKREDAPVDSLYLQTSSKRARPNLAPQVYFKRLTTATTSSRYTVSSLAFFAHQQQSAVDNGADSSNSTSTSIAPQSLNEEDAETLREARLLAPPSSLLYRSSSDGLANGDAFYHADGTRVASGDERPPLILDEDGCPAILSGPAEEQLRDPYALRQRQRIAQEASTSTRGVGQEGPKRRVVVQRRIGGGTAGAGSSDGPEQTVFSIARGHEQGHELMDLDHGKPSSMEDGEFVYDVFVPETIANAKNLSISTSSSNAWATAQPPGLAGTVLVNEDDADWIGDYFYEGNAAEDEDEDRVYSDDEDSNAEDYYGADYPEDEDEDYNDDFDDTDQDSD